MHVHFRRQPAAARAFLHAVLGDAVAAGELRADTDVAALARMVETATTGSLFTWATYRDEDATSWILKDLDVVLAPYRV